MVCFRFCQNWCGSRKPPEHASTSLLNPELDDVWLRAQKAVPRFHWHIFGVLLFVPVAMIVLFSVAFVHDLMTENQPQHCYVLQGVDDGLALAWAGWFVNWLSLDVDGNYHCDLVPVQGSLFVYYGVLVPTWVTILVSSWKTRRQRRDHGTVRSLLEKVFLAVESDEKNGSSLEGYLGQVVKSEQSLSFIRTLVRDGQRTKKYNVACTIALQVIMFVFDCVVKEYTWRWVVWYQVLWFSFSATIWQVTPLVTFSACLSRTLIDLYIELLRERRASWLQLLEWHRELELHLLGLWGKINLHAVMAALPFLSLSIVHLLVDANQFTGTVVASFLLAVAGLVLVTVLRSIASLNSMVNSALAIKGGCPLAQGDAGSIRSSGSLAIVAVARSMAVERPERTPAEDQQYATFLEYVQGAKFCLALGWPGFVMVPITSAVVTEILQACIFKLPLFVSLFLAIKSRVIMKDKP